MKNLILACLAVFLGSTFLFGLLTLAKMEKAAVLPIAAMPLSGVVYVHQVLEKKEIKPNFRALPKGVVTLQGFALPWYQMLVYGTLIFAAVKQLGGFIGGYTAGSAGALSGDALIIIAAVISNLMAAVAIYAICFWIGTRCTKYDFLVAVAVLFLGNMVGVSIDFLFLSETEFSSLFHQPKTIAFFVVGVITGTLLLVLFAVFGVWRGRRARLSAYLSYLLGILPADTRETIINLAYEEVKGLSSNQIRDSQLNT